MSALNILRFRLRNPVMTKNWENIIIFGWVPLRHICEVEHDGGGKRAFINIYIFGPSTTESVIYFSRDIKF